MKDKDLLKLDRELLARELSLCGARSVHKANICCPFHDDKHPSAEIRQSKETGSWYFKCHTCNICLDYWGVKAKNEGRDVGEVLKELSKDTPQVYRSNVEQTTQDFTSFDTIDDLLNEGYLAWNRSWELKNVFPYIDPIQCIADYYIARFWDQDRKRKVLRPLLFRDGRWYPNHPSELRRLYNLQKLNKFECVLVVEGEPKVDCVNDLGTKDIHAVTSSGGAGSAARSDWRPLAGKKVYLWPDNDKSGHGYMDEVTEQLKRLEPECQIFRINVDELGLEEKEDIVDYFEANPGTPEERVGTLKMILDSAVPVREVLAIEERFHKITSGQFEAIKFPQFPMLSALSKALLPGCLTTICGDPGAGKTFLSIETCWRLRHFGVNVKALMLEEDDAFYQQRALAQMASNSSFVDAEFVKDHPEQAGEAMAKYYGQLKQFARDVETTKTQKSLPEIAAWVEDHAENGVRVLIVDPITMAQASKEPWIADQSFITRVQPVLDATGASLILVTHPRIGQAGKPSLSGVAGGAAYPRFSQSVLWLVNHDKEQESPVWDGYLRPRKTYKRTIQLRKTRNGSGQGRQIAVTLNKENLCFEELGIIEGE